MGNNKDARERERIAMKASFYTFLETVIAMAIGISAAGFVVSGIIKMIM